jgi:hypothetical protein
MFDAKAAEVVEEVYVTTGAILIGRLMFDVGVEPWGDRRLSGCRYSCSPTRDVNRYPAGRHNVHLRGRKDSKPA